MRVWFSLGLVALLVIVAGDGNAQTVIRDNFGQTSQRNKGDMLNKTRTSTGEAVWDCSKNLVVSEDGGKWSLVVNGGHLFLAKVPFVASGGVVRVEASVRPVRNPDAEQNGFITVGFGNPTTYNITWLGGIYLTLNADGKAGLAIHPDSGDATEDPNKGGSVMIAKKAIISFHADGMNHMVLEYDPEHNSVSAWINDEVIAEGCDLTSKNFTPSLKLAGFSGFEQKMEEPAVADFSFTVK